MKDISIFNRLQDYSKKYKSIKYNQLIEFLNKNNITEIYTPKYHTQGSCYEYIFIANNELIHILLESAWKRIFLEVIERELILAKVFPEKENKEPQSPIIFMQ